MKTKSKIVFAILFVMLLVLQISLPCSADSSESPAEITQDRYSYISRTYCSLSISGLTATAHADLTTKSSCNMSISMELQKLKSGSYSTVQTWNTSDTGTSLSLTKTKLINVLSTYRLKVTFTAGSETVTAYSYP